MLPPERARPLLTAAFDLLLIALIAAAIVWPVFHLEYLDSWGSIESTFISDARFLAGNSPHPLWQPNWYCGTRWDYIYPPGLRYGTAYIHKWTGVSVPRAYHIFIGLFYCAGIAGVYALVRAASKSRAGAWMAAVASLLISPGYLFLPDFRADVSSFLYLPNRLNVLIRYGEGPHMSSYAVLLWALAAAWFGLRRGRGGWLALSAVFCALLVSINFYGATALAMCFPVLVWAVWLGERDHRVWLRAVLIAGLAYGLDAFWLTPSYLRVTTENLRLVSQPGNRWSLYVALAVLAAFCVFTWRWAKGRPERSWYVFVLGIFTFFTLNVVGEARFGFRIAGEPSRLSPELDLVLILAGVELLRRLARTPARFGPVWLPRALAAALFAAAMLPAKGYVRQAWTYFPEYRDHTRRIEYRLTKWMAENLPATRAFAAGTVRFWYNGWFDLPQVGGGSEQGLMNMFTVVSYYHLTYDTPLDENVLWMQAMGAGAIIVNDEKSESIYKDFANPSRFRGKLRALHDSGEGDVIYEIPRRFPELARVVRRADLDAVPALAEQTNMDDLRAYVRVIEEGPATRVRMIRESPERIRLQALLAEGESLVVQETYDPSWRAVTASGSVLPVRRDQIGFMRIDAPPGQRDLLLEFTLPRENAYGRIAAIASALFCLYLVIPWFRGRGPALAAPAVLLLASVTLNVILLFPGETHYRDSIETGYASIARTIALNPNPWGWDPTHYFGIATQFLYLPLLPYLSAAIWRVVPEADFVYLWRLLMAAFALLAPLSVYALVRYFTRSRWWAFLSALGFAVLSPGYGLFDALDGDRGLAQLPWRLQVLAKYGEGPHNAGLALLPLAILAAWHAATRGGFARLFLAAVAMAAVTTANWIAAVALAWCMLAMLLTGAGTWEWTNFRARRLLAAALLAYLLCAFWLTPTFIATMAFNWPKDSYGYKLQSAQGWMMAGLVFGAILLRALFWRARRSTWLCYLTLTAFGFAWIVAGFYWRNENTLPESRRYALEFELFVILLFFEIWRRLAQSPFAAVQIFAAIAALCALSAGAGQVARYAATPYHALYPLPPERTAEYRVVRELERLHPEGRALVSGGTRYRLNAYTSVAQLGGTFESGLRNRIAQNFLYQIRTGLGSQPGEEARDALAILRSTGVEYAAIHGEESSEYFRDFKNPDLFEGMLPRVYYERDNAIYRLPFESLAYAVPPGQLPRSEPKGYGHLQLANYARAIETRAAHPLRFQWTSPSRLELRGGVPPGHVVSVQVLHDPGWRASQDGKPVPASADGIGFLVLEAAPRGATQIVLEYSGSGESKFFAAVSAAAWLLCLAALARGWRESRRV